MQSVFLDIYDYGIEYSVKNNLDNSYVHSLAAAASRVLYLSHAAQPTLYLDDYNNDNNDNNENQVDENPAEGIEFIIGKPSCEPVHRKFDTAPIYRLFPIPAVFATAETLQTRVQNRPGADRYEKLQEALLRACFLIAKNAIATKIPAFINRIFPEGLEHPDRTHKIVSYFLKRPDRIDPTAWKNVSDSSGIYPQYFSATTVSQKVKYIETVEGRGPLDLDAVVAWLYGRGVSLGNCPRYSEYDVEMAIASGEKAGKARRYIDPAL